MKRGWIILLATLGLLACLSGTGIAQEAVTWPTYSLPIPLNEHKIARMNPCVNHGVA